MRIAFKKWSIFGRNKAYIIKQIKDRSLFSSIPESETIQNVLNVIYFKRRKMRQAWMRAQ